MISVNLCVFSVQLCVIFFVTQSYTEGSQSYTEVFWEAYHLVGL